METIDPWGLAYSETNPLNIAGFDAAITSYLAARADTMSVVQTILDDDPDMLMAVCLRGYLLRLAAHPQFKSALRQVVSHAQALAERGHANARERVHVKALSLWCEDRGDKALAALEELLTQHPMDMLALRIAHYLHFYAGMGEAMRDSTGRVLPFWPTDHPHYGYLLGMHAFGLEEAGEYDAALACGREAVAENPADIWATHAVAHVYQMRSQYEDGLHWLEGLKHQWQGTNNFRHHVVWHGALYHIGLGEPQAALRIYDEQLVQSVADDFYLDLCNNAALLWRLEFLGLEVGERWQQLADISAGHARDQELAFASLHYLIPLAVTGRSDAQTVLETIRTWSSTGGEQGQVCKRAALQLAQAIVDSAAQPERAAQALVDAKHDLFRIGGSKAQRDLFCLLADHDARRAERDDLVGMCR